jgi:heme-degrading monooxygenase HmoA
MPGDPAPRAERFGGEHREKIVAVGARRREEQPDVSVILINPFEVPEGTNDEEFLRGWERAADYMRQQPGFVSTRLHRALRPDAHFRFVNVAEWESPQDFQVAVGREQFREIAQGAATGSPALYEVVRSV